jgi:hypothetical protein
MDAATWRCRSVVVAAFFWLLLTYRDYPAIIASGIARERAMITGMSAYRSGDYSAAERAFRVALTAQPNFVDAQVHLALALKAQGRYEEALAALQRNSSRRTELVVGALLRETGDPAQAASILTYIETVAGEDIQRWALEWLRPPPVGILAVGNGLDIGYLAGFSPAEQNATGGFRWLEGQGVLVLPLAEPLRDDAVLLLSMTGGEAEATTPLTVRIGDGAAWSVPVVRGGVAPVSSARAIGARDGSTDCDRTERADLRSGAARSGEQRCARAESATLAGAGALTRRRGGWDPLTKWSYWERSGFLHSCTFLPLIPPTPFSHEERRGSLGILKPKTREGTQRLPKKPTPVSFSHKERRGSLGVLKPKTREGTQGLPKKPTSIR